MTGSDAEDIGKVLEQIIAVFDAMGKDTIHERRAAFKPLHDFAKQATRHVLVEYMGLEPAMIDEYGLSRRYERIAQRLELLNDPNLKKEAGEWRSFISNNFEKTRNRLEHSDYADADDLAKQRERIIGFVEWIFQVGSRYYRASPSFSARSRYIQMADTLTWQIEREIDRYGVDIPYAITRSDTLGEGAAGWQNLPNALEQLKKRVASIRVSEEPGSMDYELLMELDATRNRLDAAERVVMMDNKCPRCGGQIEEENETHYHGDPEDASGVAIIWVGCTSCRFEVHSDQIDF